MKKTQKRVGIWMDHASAHIMEHEQEPIRTKNLESKPTHQEELDGIGKNEYLIHSKEQHEQADYYKKLGEIIQNYDEVVLFGPTNAKVELFNILTEDHRFAEVKIFIKQADKMTENQQHAFVKDYFSK